MALGTGSGAFAAATTSTSPPSITALALTDYNGDGKLDVVGANGSLGVVVMLGMGDGSFGAYATYPLNAPTSHRAQPLGVGWQPTNGCHKKPSAATGSR